ncbi:Bax inhibitor [Nesidiocoris tenuis]|uniref:Bax inhibitor n=1 Tax=Nesidiocoris tenuis TaxID=355587 RepID=A0ABN7AVW6_9HEMI|nr:Bax inhibitor [Nesidiocoris tenuis]
MITLDSFIRSFNSKLDEPLKQHLKNVYACVMLSLMSAAVGAYVDMFTNFMSNSILTLLAPLGLLTALHYTKDNGKNTFMRLSLLLGFAFFTGLSIGPLTKQVIMIDPQIVTTSLVSTSLVFLMFSLSAIFAERGSWLYLGGTITSLLSAMFVFSLISLFFRTTMFFQVSLYIGLILMCAFVLYDTQLIMEKRRQGDKDFIAHSVDLFIDFLGIFRRLMIILAQKEDQKREKKN